MLQLYGSTLSAPTNKVRYVANYLNIPFEFHAINLSAGENRREEFLKINPLGKIPAIADENFVLGESNAIIRYLADKQHSDLYPRDIQQRAIIDEWIDFSSQHIASASSKIMFNTYFYKFANVAQDQRSLEEGRQFLAKYLPGVEQQLLKNKFIAANQISLADFVLLAALDVCELAGVDLTNYPHIKSWREKLMQESFYTSCYESYTTFFQQVMAKINFK